MKKLLPLLFLAACGGSSHHDDASVNDDLSGVPHDMAVTNDTGTGGNDDGGFATVDLLPATDMAPATIVATPGTWTWVDVDGAVCNDGSQTGIGVNPGTETDKLLIFYNGGGACGSYDTCYQLKTASLGPYGASQFASDSSGFGGSITDRTLANNPFATWTYVFVPYCTGDLHGGIFEQKYTSDDGTDTQTFHHAGHINALRDYDTLAKTWPNLTTLVVSGSSGGGYGALINYDDARKHWPTAKSYLIDDSGPPLEPNVEPSLLSQWIDAWGLLNWAQTVCPACTSDVSQFIPVISKAYPNDRLALLETLQDQVIRTYWFLSATNFQTALEAMAADRIAPTDNFKYFFVGGETHTMLGDAANATYTSGTTQLMTFINDEVSDSSAWTSTSP